MYTCGLTLLWTAKRPFVGVRRPHLFKSFLIYQDRMLKFDRHIFHIYIYKAVHVCLYATIYVTIYLSMHVIYRKPQSELD